MRFNAFNFAGMKKSTIWVLGIVMGLSFLSLLYLQVSYIEEMVKMRKGQFDESVQRSLVQACRNIELVETKKYLEDDGRISLSSRCRDRSSYRLRQNPWLHEPRSLSPAHSPFRISISPFSSRLLSQPSCREKRFPIRLSAFDDRGPQPGRCLQRPW